MAEQGGKVGVKGEGGDEGNIYCELAHQYQRLAF